MANSDWARVMGNIILADASIPAPPTSDEENMRATSLKGLGMNFSGKAVEFTSGARREDKSDAPRPDLVSPFALMRLGKWMGLGAKKHGDRNWEKGLPFSSMLQAIWRHLLKWMMSWEDEDHLAAVLFNVQALMHFEDTKRMELDDLPKYGARDKEETSAK
jgi:hypothetical protein